MNLDEFRSNNPAYADKQAYPDEMLADGLHKKYYSDIPREQFNQQIGIVQEPGMVDSITSLLRTPKKLPIESPVTPLARDSMPEGSRPFTEIMQPPTEDQLANKATLGESAQAILQMLGDVPEHTVPAIQNLLSGSDIDVFNPTPEAIESNQLIQQRAAQPGGEKQVIPGISVGDFRQASPSIPFSAISSVAGLAGGAAALPAAALPIPGARAIPWMAGSAASGAAAYRQDVAMFMQDAYDAYNQKSIEETGEPLSPEQWEKRKEDISDIATRHGLWEALPEAAGNVAQLKLIISPLKKYLGKSILTRLPAKYAGILGVETGTETIAQTGQQTAEAEAGIPGAEKRSFTSPEDISKSFGEVAPTAAILSTLMGLSAGGVKGGVDVAKKGIPGTQKRKQTNLAEAMQEAVNSASPSTVQGIVDALSSQPPAQPTAQPARRNLNPNAELKTELPDIAKPKGQESQGLYRPESITPEEESKLNRSQKAKEGYAKRKTVKNTDELKTVIAKLGGLNSEEAIAQGATDSEGLKTRGFGIQRVFTKNGASFDEMAEKLDELGFDVRDGAGYDANKVVSLVSQSLSGSDVFSIEGYESDIEKQAKEREYDTQDQYYDDLSDIVYENDFNQNEVDLTDVLGRSRDILGDEATDAILERTSIQGEGLSDEEFRTKLIDNVEAKINETTKGSRASERSDEGMPAQEAGTGQESKPSQETDLELTTQTEKEIKAKEAAEKKPAQELPGTAEERQKLEADTFRLGSEGEITTEAEKQGDMLSEPIQDFGEKIGGARKDTAQPLGKRGTAKKDTRPAWKKRFVIVESVMDDANNGKWLIMDKRTGKPLRGAGYKAMAFDTEAEAKEMQAIAAVAQNHSVYTAGDGKFTVYRKVGTRKRVQVVPDLFDTRDDAMKYMAKNAESILESKLNFGEEVLPKPETVYRSGEERRTGNATKKDFEDTFAFRAVEFGKWENQDERREVMNHAYDSLLDLAEIIDVPPKALSLNGDLALAFGARGQGLTGAAAHYERDYAVINLTKMSGAGHLAHEWLHSLDHYFGRIDGKAAAEMVKNEKGHNVFKTKSREKDYASHGFSYKSSARPEVQEAYENLIVTMFKKAETYVEDTQKAEDYVGKARDELRRKLDGIINGLAQQLDPKYWKRNNKPATIEQLTRFDELSDMLINGESLELERRENTGSKSRYGSYRSSNDVLDEMAAIYKKVRGRSGFTANNEGVFNDLRWPVQHYADRIKALKDARGEVKKEKKVPTDYYMQARAADQARAKEYWASPHEMAARAFAAYVEDKLVEKDASNDFLAYYAHGAVMVPIYPEGLFRPYPEGKEREATNKAFENLFDVIETKETERVNDKGEVKKGVAMFSRKPAQPRTVFPESKDQSGAKLLNEELASMDGFGTEWRNAYAQNELPDSLSDFGDAVKAGFNRRIIPVTPTEDRFSLFNGIYANKGTLYVSTQANVGFVNVAGHELYHDLKRRRPDLHEWLVGHLNDHVVNFNEYAEKLDALVQEGEEKHTIDKVQEELLADFTGDALADPVFLEKLAEDNPSKFKALLRAVIVWFNNVKNKLRGNRSEKYINDVDRMRDHLRSAMNAYAEGDTISEVVGEPEFLPVWHGSPYIFDRFDISKVGTGEGAQAYGHGMYLAETKDIGENYKIATSYRAWDAKEAAKKYGIELNAGGRGELTRQGQKDIDSMTAAKRVQYANVAARDIPQEKLAALIDDYRANGSGNLYEIDLPDSMIERMLDWDAPLSEQPESVRKALTEEIQNIRDNPADWPHAFERVQEDANAGDFYKALTRDHLSPGWDIKTGQMAASLQLNSLGIPGIKYYDGGSRAAGEGTRNFVIFDPSSLKILSRNGEPLSKAEKEGLVSEEGQSDIRFSRISDTGVDFDEDGQVATWFDELRFQAQDKFHYLNKVEKSAAQSRGINELPESEDPSLAEIVYHGKAGEAIDSFKNDHVDPLIDAITESDLSLEEVESYLWARHAPEANDQLERINSKDGLTPDLFGSEIEDNKSLSGMSNEESQDIIDSFNEAGKLEALQDIGRKVDVITQARRDLLVSSGLETQDTIDKWEDVYSHYVPLHREGKQGRLPAKGMGFDVRGKEKRRAGSRKEVVNILAHLVAQYEATAIKAEKVKVARAMLKFAENNPSDLYEVDKVEYKPSFNKDGLVTYREDKGHVLADNILVVRRDGIDHRVTFNEEDHTAMRIAYAMKNLGANESGPIMNVLSKYTRWLAMVNTGLNPEFVISNFARDLQTAGYNLSDTEADKLKWKIIKDVGKAWSGIRKYQKGKPGEWATYFDEFRKDGAQTGWLQAYDNIESREKALVKKIKDLESNSSLVAIKHGMQSALEFIEDENTAVENGIRLSAYVHARRSGISRTKAARMAKELTVNFNKKGAMGPVLNALYLFYNASIQGSVRLIQAAVRSPKVRRLIGYTVVFAAILDMVNRVMGGDDDDGIPYYDKLVKNKPWLLERNLIIMSPSEDGSYIKIPLPWGYNVFHVMGQSVGQAINMKGFSPVTAAGNVASSVVGAFNPVGSESSLAQMVSPTITDPIVQWGENKDWSGRPLRPGGNPFDVEKPSSQQYWNSAREPSKVVAEKLNELTGGDKIRPGVIDISPEAIDLMIDTFTGGAGRFVSDFISTPIKAIKEDDIETYEIPMLRKVYGRPGVGDVTQEYYENSDKIRIAEKQYKHYEDDTKKRKEIREKYRDELLLVTDLKQARKDLLANSKEIKAIEQSGLDEDRKKERIDKLRDRRVKVMERFNRRYNRRIILNAQENRDGR